MSSLTPSHYTVGSPARLFRAFILQFLSSHVHDEGFGGFPLSFSFTGGGSSQLPQPEELGEVSPGVGKVTVAYYVMMVTTWGPPVVFVDS